MFASVLCLAEIKVVLVTVVILVVTIAGLRIAYAIDKPINQVVGDFQP